MPHCQGIGCLQFKGHYCEHISILTAQNDQHCTKGSGDTLSFILASWEPFPSACCRIVHSTNYSATVQWQLPHACKCEYVHIKNHLAAEEMAQRMTRTPIIQMWYLHMCFRGGEFSTTKLIFINCMTMCKSTQICSQSAFHNYPILTPLLLLISQ